MRTSYSFKTTSDFESKALHYANQFSHVVYLNPNSYNYPYGAFNHLLAFGVYKELSFSEHHTFDQLKEFMNQHKDWIVGYFSYDLKNETESLTSKNTDSVSFPSISFFIPEHLIFFNENESTIFSKKNPETIFSQIQAINIQADNNPSKNISIKQRITKEQYLNKVISIQRRILEGELYEMNFCQEYYSENSLINPVDTYFKLNEVSAMPFSCFVKTNDHYLLCASPERFLKKEKQKLISQPIKGTAPRNSDPLQDENNRLSLLNSEKERAENVMIVDLVRNDLSRTAIEGTVKVEELQKVYSFPNVHQMISTITAEVKASTHPVDIIKNAFPMGSMTGAPKIRAMKIIDEYEETKRGLFSGAVGYFSPEGDFDFNVVIRSILYNAKTKYLSFQAGSAITYYADPEKEYEECSVKTAAIRKTLTE